MKNVTVTKPVDCGASLADAYAAVDSLTRQERAELLHHLVGKYGLAAVRGIAVP